MFDRDGGWLLDDPELDDAIARNLDSGPPDQETSRKWSTVVLTCARGRTFIFHGLGWIFLLEDCLTKIAAEIARWLYLAPPSSAHLIDQF